MERWEYKVVGLAGVSTQLRKSDGGPVSIETLDALGTEAWEAVGVGMTSGDLVARPFVLFKRRLSS
jgi:hypothetical protein